MWVLLAVALAGCNLVGWDLSGLAGAWLAGLAGLAGAWQVGWAWLAGVWRAGVRREPLR